MSSIVLHDYARSSAAYRVRIALNLKGLSYEQRPVNIVAGEQQEASFRAKNPQGLVPMLEMDGLQLTQSLAIIDYLDARFPEPAFVPRDLAQRSQVLAMALAIACDIHPLNNLRVLRYLADPLGRSQGARDEWYRHWIVEGFAALEVLAAGSAGSWLGGAALSIADICLVPQMFNARRFETPLDAYPTLVRIDAAAQAHSAFAAAHPANQEQPS